MPYIGKSPHFGVRNRFIYTASGSETSKSGADDNGATLTFTDGAYVDVYLNGVLLKPDTDYVTSTANTIGSLSALSTSDILEVIVYDVFSVSDTVSAASGGTFVGNVNFSGAIDVDGTTNLDVVDIDGALTQDGGAVFNEDSADVDFRVESNSNTHMLFVDGGNNNVTMQSTSAGASTTPFVLHNASSNASTDVRMLLAPCTTAADRPVILSAVNNGSNVVNFGISTPNGGTPIQRVTVAGSDGTIDVETGDIFFSTAGKGIVLGATSNTDANTLDDYEEGTWTAAISTTSGSITPDASFKTGHYTKVGKLVTVNLHLRASSVSSPSGSCQITGLPFTTVNNDEYRFSGGACVHYTATGMDDEAVFILSMSENQSKLTVNVQNGNNLTSSTAAKFTTNTEIYMNMFYYV